VARPPLSPPAPEHSARGWRLRWLSGLDRSDAAPPATRAGEPLRPWTIPNAIGYLRGAMLVAFLVLALASEGGTDALPAALYIAVAWGDQLDGLAARLTGQYSRLGALMDPLIDRALVVCGVVVTWRFDLLPRWALAVLVAREALMLAFGPLWVRRGHELRITMLGRLAVWPTMVALGFGLCGVPGPGRILLYIGLAMTLGATAQYARQLSTSA
jgi:cardiolipin synthase